jgi:putative membrane protein
MILRFLLHWVFLVLALYLLTVIGLASFDQPSSLLWAALLLIIFNAILRPLLIIFTLPLVVFTLGLFILVINALMLYWIPSFVTGFHVPGFWSAFFGSILLSIITGLFGGWEKLAKKS